MMDWIEWEDSSRHPFTPCRNDALQYVTVGQSRIANFYWRHCTSVPASELGPGLLRPFQAIH